MSAQRWLALDRRDPRRKGLPTVEVVAAEDYDVLARDYDDLAADFGRLRTERDRAIEQRENANRASVRVELELARLRTERDELRRAVGRDRSTPLGAGQPDARGDGTERHHDTLTEEKT